MAINKDIFSSVKFRSTIESYCRENNWPLSHIDNDKAILEFKMESGNEQTVFIVRYDNTLEISCPSGFKFSDQDDIPHGLSTVLLQKNSQSKIGFWCIEKITGKQVFSIMHNIEISLMDAKYFTKVVVYLVNSCDEFEQTIESVLN